MAGQYDGTILINTSIDTDGFKAGGKEVEAAMRKAAQSVKNIGDTAKVSLQKSVEAFANQNQQVATQKQKVEDLRKELERLGNTKVKTDDYAAILKEASDLQDKLEKVKKAQEDFLNAGGKFSSSAYKRRSNQILELTQDLRRAKEMEASMRHEGTAYQPADTSAVESKYIAESEKLQQMNTRLGLSYDALKAKISSLNKSTNESTGIKGRLASAIGALGAKIKGILPGMNQMNKSAKKSGLSLKKLLMYGFGFRSLFALFNRLRSAVVSGFQNLSQYSGRTNADISMLMSSLTQLKNSLATAFAPILSVVAPILSKFIGMLSTAASYVSQFLSALTGKSTYVKAVKVQQDYAAGLKKTGDNAKDAKKELQGYLSPIDEINKKEKENADASSGSGAGGGLDPSKMFETKPIDSNVMSLAEKVKKAFAEMFAPLADAWQIYGPSIKKSLGKIKQDFIDFFVEIGTATVDWAKNLDWKPLLASVDNLLQKLEPLIDLILDDLAWAYENVLLPLGKWVIEDAGPAAIDVFASALDFLTSVLEALEPLALWLWDNFLSPIAEWTGGVIVTVLEGIATALTKLSDWIDEHQTAVENFTLVVLAFMAAWGIVDLAVKISGIVTSLVTFVATGGLATAAATGLGAAIAFLTSPITIAIAAITALIVAGVLLYKNWDAVSEKAQIAWAFVQSCFQKFDDFLQRVFVTDWVKYFGVLGYAIQGFSDTIQAIWNGIKLVFNGFITFLSGVFSGNWRQAILGLVQIFGGVFQTIEKLARIPINSVIGLINGMLSAVTSGVNWVLKKVNTLSFDVPDWVPEIGGKHFGFDFSTFTAPKIPYLATGAVIPANAPFTAVLGDQKHGNNIEAPEALIRKIVREESGSRGGTYHFTGQINRRVLFDEFITEAKLRQDQTGVNPLTSF
nr:MAG TPA: minor tail protein [Caudoviricetes sp.]